MRKKIFRVILGFVFFAGAVPEIPAASGLLIREDLDGTIQEAVPGKTVKNLTPQMLQTLIFKRFQELGTNAPLTVDRDEERERIADEPRTRPSPTQSSAPSSANLSPGVVDRPSFSELIGLAFDNDFVAFGEGTASLNLNAFLFLALANPAVVDSQEKYGGYGLLRRFGGAVHFGGTGDAFDRDGDGKEDKALKAENMGDIIQGQLKFRLIGSRDRRDQANFKIYDEKARLPLESFDRIMRDFVDSLIIKCSRENDQKNKILPEDIVAAYLETEPATSKLRDLAAAWQAVERAYEQANEEIDRRFLATIQVGGLFRKGDQFGPDRYSIGLSGVWGLGTWDQTLNLEYSRIEGLNGRSAGKLMKIGFESSTLWLKGSSFCEDGISTSIGIAAEFTRDIPEAVHRSTIKIGAGLEYPLSDSVTLPLSIVWANHRDLLSEESIVRGHVGISFDLSKNKKKNDKN